MPTPSHRRYTVEEYDDDKWVLSEATGLDASLRLPTIDCQLLLREVYDKVELVAEV